jgi:serine/threonine protein kinase
MVLPLVKLADFGFTRPLPKTSLADSICGSPLYMAPEVLNRISYDYKADLWSLGVVLFELMTGHVLFQVSNQLELCLQMRLYNNDVDFGVVGCRYSNELKDLIQVLLKKKPDERVSSEAFCYYVDLVVTKDEMKDKAEISVIGSVEMREAKDAEDDDEFVVVDCNETVIEEPTISNQRRHSSPNDRQQQNQQQQVPRIRTLSNGASILTKAIASISPMNLFGDNNNGSKPSFLLSSTTSTIVDQTVYFEAMETPNQSNQLPNDLKQINDILESIMAFADEKHSLFEKDPCNQVLAEESLSLTLKISSILRLSIQKYKESLMNLEVVDSFVWMKNMLKLYTQRMSQFPTMVSSCSVEHLLYDRAMNMVN